MSGGRRHSAIERILGVPASAGPLEVLGLSLSECTPARVESALEWQLERVDQHHEADTPEADEVRLALHTAAAQLLDPRVRALLMQQAAAGEVSAEFPSPAERPSAPAIARDESRPYADAVSSSSPVYMPAPEREQATPVAEAPWPVTSHVDDHNRSTKKLLIGAGVFAGLLLVVVVGALAMLTRSGPAPAMTSTGGSGPSVPPTAPSPAPTSASPPSASSQNAATTPSTPAPVTPPSAAGEPPPDGAVATSDDAAVVRAPFRDPGAVVRALRVAVEKVKTDPAGGLKDFRASVREVGDWWAKFDRAQRRAADDAVVEFIYAAGDASGVGDAAVAEIAKLAEPLSNRKAIKPDSVWSSIWACGVLARLSGERELSRGVMASVRAALGAALGQGRTLGGMTFDAGADAALRELPEALLAPTLAPGGSDEVVAARVIDSFMRWTEAVDAGVADAAAREGVLVDGLERVLATGHEPEDSPAVYGVVEHIASRIRWRSGGVARTKLLGWFNDGRISESDLRVVTGVIASKSSAEGVDATMVLSVSATPEDRAKLRARYAQAWGVTQAGSRAEVIDRWKAAAQASIDVAGIEAPTGSSATSRAPAQLAIELAVQTRVNQAARRIWLGDSDGAGTVLRDLPSTRSALENTAAASTPTIPMSPAGPPLSPPAQPASPPPAIAPITPGRRQPSPASAAPAPQASDGGDGQWAESYLKAEQNIPIRLDRLAALTSMQPPLGRLDAAVLADAACLGAPMQVRFAAQQQAMRFADDPGMVRAMLDALPTAPKVLSVTSLYQRVARATLPKQGDPEWETAARRALVERLLSMLAVEGEQQVINASSAVVADAYAAMSLNVGAAPPDESSAELAARAAGQLFSRWKDDAERIAPPQAFPVTLEQIARRRDARDRTASGVAQQFTARQMAVADVLGYIVASERPLDAGKCASILSELNVSRRNASHVFEQMLATERAITRLWQLRLAEGKP